MRGRSSREGLIMADVAQRALRALRRVRLGFVLPFAVSAVALFAILGVSQMKPASTAPRPWVELTKSSAPGGHVELQLVIHHPADIGGFEASLRYDRAA